MLVNMVFRTSDAIIDLIIVWRENLLHGYMNLSISHKRLDGHVKVGNRRINNFHIE